jgi:hypothetical protein
MLVPPNVKRRKTIAPMRITPGKTNSLCFANLKREDQTRQAKIAKFVCVIGVALLLSEAVSYGQNPVKSEAETKPVAPDIAPPSCDFGQLGLQVTSVETVPSIRSMGREVCTPVDGYKIVVVSFKSNSAVPNDFARASNWSDIEAVYGASDRDNGLGFAIAPASAFFIEELQGGVELWAFSQTVQSGATGMDGMALSMGINGQGITSTAPNLLRMTTYRDQLSVAFVLPVSVKAITIRIPVAVKDDAGHVVHEIK